jgi:hypothetical protein
MRNRAVLPAAGGIDRMGLKAPGIITFLAAVVLTVVVLVVRFFGAEIPLLKGNEFFGLLFAQVLLITACVLRLP